jgi:hypothetical protein
MKQQHETLQALRREFYAAAVMIGTVMFAAAIYAAVIK